MERFGHVCVCVCEGQRASKEKMGERREVKTPAKERWVLVQLQF